MTRQGQRKCRQVSFCFSSRAQVLSGLLLVIILLRSFLKPIILPASSPPPLSHVATPHTTLPTYASTPELCTVPLGFLPRSSRILLLASYPGSGNTWVRHVLQQATRIYTGSVYNDKSILEQFPAEGTRDGSVLCVKTHFPCPGCWNRKSSGRGPGKPITLAQSGDLKVADAAIYIVRNPFDAILAEFKRKMTGLNHTGIVDPGVFNLALWPTFAIARARTWTKSVDFFMSSHIKENIWKDARGRTVHVLYFEKLKAQYAETLRGVLTFLFDYHSLGKRLNGATVDDALQCALMDRTGSFKRSAKGRFNPYSPELVEKICSLTKKVWSSDIWGQCDGLLSWEKPTSSSR